MGLKRENTKSTLFSKLNKINNLLVDEIDNDQEMKRLFSYLTYQPLLERSMNIDNKMIYQPDITSTMTREQKLCISKPTSTKKEYLNLEPILYPYPFQEEKVNSEYCVCFIYWATSHVKSYDYICDNIFYIDVLVPIKYIELKPYGENRGYTIIDRLAYLFNGVSLDEESQKELGDLRFEVVGTVASGRITKSNDIIRFTVPIKVSDINARYGNMDGIRL